MQGYGFAVFAESIQGAVATPGFAFRMQMTFFLTVGAIFVMWLGEQITERGIGNGASLDDLLLDRRAHLAGHRDGVPVREHRRDRRVLAARARAW